MPIFITPGVTAVVNDVNSLEIDGPRGIVRNVATGTGIAPAKCPPLLEKIFQCGGFPAFARERYLAEGDK